MIKTCDYCTKEFEAKTKRALYCQTRCREYSKRKRVKTGFEPTPRQRLMVKLHQEGLSKKAAYLKAYNKDESKLKWAGQQAVDMFDTRGAKLALLEYKNLAEQTLVDAMSDWGRSDKPREREIAIDAAKFVHDKIEGKATQKVETKSQVVSFSINLQVDEEIEQV